MKVIKIKRTWRTGWDSNPREGCPSTPLAGERLRPLGHLSTYSCIMWTEYYQENFTLEGLIFYEECETILWKR